ncbi:hypothetical protein BN946_scf184829.g41 [Trametes cinnabarina]|uniref:SET domain-containing protein n=1 Tax=Pycnoporus cinnabarinus TaxID=5643 RepID=A0A060SEW1_PYCCI|nr:hypothetical protein BN946_scf184829.g41 [Trametes cinnabarina]
MEEANFRPSPSPAEQYEGDPTQEWVVAGVVKWGEGWKRRDGTNTTWEKPGSSDTVDALIRRWDRRQRQKRLAKAERSAEIAVQVEDHQMLHEDKTFYELARGCKELSQLYPDDPTDRPNFDATVVDLGLAAGPSVNAGAAESAERSLSPEIPPSSPPSSPPPRVVRPLPRRTNFRRIFSTSPASFDGEAEEKPRSRVSRRAMLEAQWAAKLDGAAPVTIVNTLNAEEVPPLVDGFEYIERHYVRAPNVPSNKEYADCLRLFTFSLPPGMESCTCSERCPNRVAQLPRDTPIEVFRTRNRGWGARATVPLVRGKVVGIYTGSLVSIIRTEIVALADTPAVTQAAHLSGPHSRRADADRRVDDRGSYLFDLDVHEGSDDDEDDNATDKYSVDGYAYGNWTRFVNHSCEPNMRVMPVVWDTIPELNQPYLAFVATQDIPARTELTIDYDPKADEEAQSAPQKEKGREAVPEGARRCMCGTASCRGWVRV